MLFQTKPYLKSVGYGTKIGTHHKTNISNTTNLVELEQELTHINPQVFHGVNAKKKEELLRVFSSVTFIQEKSHSGPLPSPESLIEYNNATPDAADRIIKMAEGQQQHRMFIEKKVVGRQLFQSL